MKILQLLKTKIKVIMLRISEENSNEAVEENNSLALPIEFRIRRG